MALRPRAGSPRCRLTTVWGAHRPPRAGGGRTAHWGIGGCNMHSSRVSLAPWTRAAALTARCSRNSPPRSRALCCRSPATRAAGWSVAAAAAAVGLGSSVSAARSAAARVALRARGQTCLRPRTAADLRSSASLRMLASPHGAAMPLPVASAPTVRRCSLATRRRLPAGVPRPGSWYPLTVRPVSVCCMLWTPQGSPVARRPRTPGGDCRSAAQRSPCGRERGSVAG